MANVIYPPLTPAQAAELLRKSGGKEVVVGDFSYLMANNKGEDHRWPTAYYENDLDQWFIPQDRFDLDKPWLPKHGHSANDFIV